MAIRYACDGCGQMVPEGARPRQLGIVLRREYCAVCAPVAEAYMTAVNEAHSRQAEAWAATLKMIRADYLGASMKALPDHNGVVVET